jgi:putative zinc finger/helix-turn-helix YgiT family protein
MNPGAIRTSVGSEAVGGRPDESCPECGQFSIVATNRPDTFQYGSGASAVTLQVTVPVRSCSSCNYEFVEGEAEILYHEAVCRHLDVMVPSEIKQIRSKWKYTRDQFARLTRLGRATLARWERGTLIQNRAYDQYLFLLSFADNIRRLQERSDDNVARPKFRCIAPQPADYTAARDFNLRAA